jgi:hypothetical protein
MSILTNGTRGITFGGIILRFEDGDLWDISADTGESGIRYVTLIDEMPLKIAKFHFIFQISQARNYGI